MSTIGPRLAGHLLSIQSDGVVTQAELDEAWQLAAEENPVPDQFEVTADEAAAILAVEDGPLVEGGPGLARLEEARAVVLQLLADGGLDGGDVIAFNRQFSSEYGPEFDQVALRFLADGDYGSFVLYQQGRGFDDFSLSPSSVSALDLAPAEVGPRNDLFGTSATSLVTGDTVVTSSNQSWTVGADGTLIHVIAPGEVEQLAPGSPFYAHYLSLLADAGLEPANVLMSAMLSNVEDPLAWLDPKYRQPEGYVDPDSYQERLRNTANDGGDVRAGWREMGRDGDDILWDTGGGIYRESPDGRLTRESGPNGEPDPEPTGNPDDDPLGWLDPSLRVDPASDASSLVVVGPGQLVPGVPLVGTGGALHVPEGAVLSQGGDGLVLTFEGTSVPISGFSSVSTGSASWVLDGQRIVSLSELGPNGTALNILFDEQGRVRQTIAMNGGTTIVSDYADGVLYAATATLPDGTVERVSYEIDQNLFAGGGLNPSFLQSVQGTRVTTRPDGSQTTEDLLPNDAGFSLGLDLDLGYALQDMQAISVRPEVSAVVAGVLILTAAGLVLCAA